MKNSLDISAQKSRLRKEAMERRSALSKEQRQMASAKATDNFFREIKLPQKSIVALYWPIGDELNCWGIIERLQKAGHQVCLPCIKGKDQPLIFREFTGENNLILAGFGTSEPDKNAKILQPGLIVLPLLGFDKKGNRLGYGKGFYDRTIAAMAKKPELCGLAFSVQEFENIPTNAHDVPLTRIVTENGLNN
ncbi:MAG: 5-formyltetrahydrofolate cyclo-ligase [Devosiaceae bacterium]|nr:5-formyltetrahydrofolate cyclo-ligase [Devosiaceae bacterium]